MPNQTDPNQNSQPTGSIPPPIPAQTTDLPPLPDFMTADSSSQKPPTPPAVTETVNVSTNTTPAQSDQAGSAAPINLPQMVASPRKKFGGGKIIATILGLFLLVGGVGAGIILIGQNQDINEKAASNTFKPPCTAGGCSTDNYPEDWVNHYRCLGVKEMGQNCNDIKVATAVESASFQFNCGTEQIDYWDGSANNSTGFTSMFYDQPCESGGGGGGGGACIPLINIYNSDWVKVENPSSLPAGTPVRVGIIDRYQTTVFNKAKFTINGTIKETTKKKEVFIIGTSGPKMTVLYEDFNTTGGETKINAQVEWGGSWY